MDKNLNQIVSELLKNHTNKFLTAREIAEWIIENKTEFCKAKMKRTKVKTTNALIVQLRAEICSHALSLEKHNVFRTADKPKRYYYADNTLKLETETKEDHKNKQEELKLYPKLAQYCKTIGVETLRIDEKLSKKNGGKNYNKWLHADIVGYKDLAENFNDITKECIVEYSCERSYLYSFEVKAGIITNSTLRKYFFQTVSNSSWANYSYLVAEGIDSKAKEELQLLCSSFNIGFIQLDKDEPEESDIIIQAQKTDIDWNMIDRIANENPDFQKYLKNISLAYKKHSNSDIQAPEWGIKA